MKNHPIKSNITTKQKEDDAMKNNTTQTNTATMKIKEDNAMKNNIKTKRILADNIEVSNDTWETGINNNDLLVGPSGSGKTRGYVIPNILHAENSLIIADTKGNLHERYGDYLRNKGYKVMHLNFADTVETKWGYNPLAYVRKYRDAELNRNGDYYNEQDVKKIAQAICPQTNSKEPFWDQAAQMYLEAFILHVLNHRDEEDHNLYEVYTFLTGMGDQRMEFIMDEECDSYPNSAFARKMRMIQQNAKAEKMDASIKGILAQHLDVVTHSGVKRMFTMKQQVDMNSFLRGKTALFLTISDSDRSQDALVNLFYTQALQHLMAAADKRPDSRLPIPVRFILDDFSTNTVIPDFDKIISVIRSREIYVSVVIQSISQLEGLYDHAKAQTIINNCDHCLYLGGTDVETADYFSKKLNRQTFTILNMPLETLFVFERGVEPRRVKKYQLEQDKVYRDLTKQQEHTAERRESEGCVPEKSDSKGKKKSAVIVRKKPSPEGRAS